MNKAFLWLFGLTLFSCTSSSQESARNSEASMKQINVSNAELLDDPRLSEIFELEEIAFFSMPEDLFIGEVSQVKVVKDKIYILDRFSTKSIYVFNRGGSFDYVLSRAGEGPGEYSTPRSFTISDNGEVIHLLDVDRKRVLNYKSSTGEFIDSYNLDFIGKEIAKIDGGFVFLTNDPDSILAITNNQFELLSQSFATDAREFMAAPLSFLEIGNEALFIRKWDENFYRVSKNGYEVKRSIQLKNPNQLNSILPVKGESYNPLTLVAKFNEIESYDNYFETKNGALFLQRADGFSNMFISDFSEEKVFKINLSSLKDDLTFSSNSMPAIKNVTRDGEYLVGFITANSVYRQGLENIEKLGRNAHSAFIEEAFKKYDPDSEQFFICFFKFRE